MENSNESTNMNPMGSMNQMNNQAPETSGHSKRNIIILVIVLLVGLVAYFFVSSKGGLQESMDGSTVEVGTDSTGDIKEITSTDDDLSSIEEDFNSIDFDSLDAGLE